MGRVGLVVGIDPGTTTAWAVLDLSGNVRMVGSGKDVGLANVIRTVHACGKVVAIGTDKRVIPRVVASAAAKLGAQVLCPKDDLLRCDKHQLAQGIPCANEHEQDALACARFALRQLAPLIARVRKAARNKTIEFDDLVIAVLESGLGVKASIAMFDEVVYRKDRLAVLRDVSLVESVAKESAALRALRVERDGLRKALSASQRDLHLEQSRNEEFILRLHARAQVRKATVPAQALSLANQRASSLAALSRSLRKRQEFLESALINHYRFIVCRRMANLGMRELKRIEGLARVQMGDVLFVLRPQEYSVDALKRLHGIGVVIATPVQVDEELRGHLGLAAVSIDLSWVRHFESIVLIDRERFETEQKRLSLIEDVISSYRKERLQATYN
ncbi:DUF460 domain-containing protein [Candidatus Woesearchaeota archaeon]|nr:DUF460 domain-containing protein [Candidatus Woesearchaeota archaeon]